MSTAGRYVVVAGAGASRLLGRERELPLMSEWAEILCKDLDEREGQLAKSIGLAPGMSAEDFEDALGKAMQFAASLPLVERFIELGGPHAGSHTTDAAETLNRQKARVDAIVEVLRVSMYRQFGRQAIDEGKAAGAYGSLTGILQAPSRNSVVFATTNYDPAIEVGLQNLDMTPNDGFAQPTWESPSLNVEGIVDWESSHQGTVPVLHLHGAVGWYLQSDGRVIRQYADHPYNPTLGVPLFLPPDPLKDPLTNPHTALIWEQFHRALAGATHVLVIGHSLNDPALVRSTQDHATQAKIGVTVYSEDWTRKAIAEHKPGENPHFPERTVTVIPMKFGPELSFTGGFDSWTRIG